MKLNIMLASASLLAISCAPSLAQQVTGVPGSPGATTTLDGKQLPPPPPNFGGVIKEKASSRRRGGPRASCRRRARPTCYSS